MRFPKPDGGMVVVTYPFSFDVRERRTLFPFLYASRVPYPREYRVGAIDARRLLHALPDIGHLERW